jgi:hypothetical protein
MQLICADIPKAQKDCQVISVFVRFWDLIFGSECIKTARKKLMKLITGETIHQHFMYQFFLRTLFRYLLSSYMYVEKATETTFVRKIHT